MSVIAKAWMAGMIQDVETIPVSLKNSNGSHVFSRQCRLQSTRTVIPQTYYSMKALASSKGFTVYFLGFFQFLFS